MFSHCLKNKKSIVPCYSEKQINKLVERSRRSDKKYGYPINPLNLGILYIITGSLKGFTA